MRVLPAVMILAVLLAGGWLIGGAGRASGDGGGWVLHDRGVVLVREGSLAGSAQPLAVGYFTDLFGPPPARWTPATMPVDFCTFQNNRPATISAEQFRDSVATAIRVWNDVEAAIGVRYTGDCTVGSRYEFENGHNEIAFDDERGIVSGTEAGQTLGLWRVLAGGSARDLLEMDIVLDEQAQPDVPFQCFQTTMTHEVGHALGFGHSDVEGDLMFPSFNPSDVATCPGAPSLSEQGKLQELYGVDRAPTVSAGNGVNIDAGASVILTASGSDPEGLTLSYEWAQLSGPSVELSPSGASVTFFAPETTGVTLVFEVTVLDPFFHRGTATVSVTVAVADRPPTVPPSLRAFRRGVGTDAEILWRDVTGASSYQFCAFSTLVPSVVSCQDFAVPTVAIDWDTTLGTKGVASDRRVLTTGVRETSLKACNSQGCSREGVGPLAGGLRWPAWEMDYDFFTLAFDVGRDKWTVFGVVNVTGARRGFTFYGGPPEDPLQTVVFRCGLMLPGAICIAVLSPGDEHFAVTTIVSSASGTPTVEHRIPIR